VKGADFVLDVNRQERIGLDEAIYCAGKTAAQVEAILDAAAQEGAHLLLTRLGPAHAPVLAGRHAPALDHDALSCTAVFGRPHPDRMAPPVGVVSAGTSDLPMAREATRTLFYYGQPVREIADVGVAGLWRLTARLEEIRACPVVIVAAGMDAALVSVLGGLVPGLVVALPTSVGYGVAQGGRPALEASLASCAPGVAVVNIDNGYGAACVALRALRIAESP
jgi:NCAIR mutase (PurE)-related protein